MPEHSIPLSIASQELLVRGIFHPLFYSRSGGNLKPQAFLPPPGKRDVSVLRLQYTDSNFCKKHMSSLRMGTEQHYAGLAVVESSAIDNANTTVDKNASSDEWNVGVVASPLTGLDMHADILYNKPVEKGKIAVALQQIVRRIILKANVFLDPDGEAEEWTGGALKAL